MQRVCLILLSVLLCIGNSDAAVRTQNAVTRQQQTAIRQNSAPSARSAVARSATVQPRTSARKSGNKTVVSRAAMPNAKAVSRAATRTTGNKSRAAVSRATTLTANTKTFGDGYNSCRDAYFSCMDQFCANQNENYRRCVCSSRLKEIQSAETKLSQTANSLKDFQSLNIDVVSKTADEVKAMTKASEGESAIKKDTAKSSQTLNNISDILTSSKQKTSTSGTNNDIKSIWSTTDLIGGTDIANLTGESLYNAVHAQCVEIVADSCSSTNLNMVASAYGMYIENDCAVLATNMNNKNIAANASIRDTRHLLQDARLENYNAHNSLSLNDCIAKVRSDITANTACGENYVHCLDATGKYLNITTGEPIYSSDFYQLQNQISLSGDVLKNDKNTLFVNLLNNKRPFAKSTLELCTDNSDEIWDEFLRQSIVEIYQHQQEKIQTVESECLQAVNDCYSKQNNSLKKFSDNSEDISLGQILELSEEMCAEKLTTCSNLYGGGSEGLSLLVSTMASITDASIAQTCPELLDKYVKNICAVESFDSVHTYPYKCRVYAPGESRYAQKEICNSAQINPFAKTNVTNTQTVDVSRAIAYRCPNKSKRYTSCAPTYFLADANGNYCNTRNCATQCAACPEGSVCSGGKSGPQINPQAQILNECGLYYVGSLYQQLVIFALQNCTRPSYDKNVLPESILADVDNAMKDVRYKLIKTLSDECDRLGGIWVDIPWTDDNPADGYHDTTGATLFEPFYNETGTNKLWGYCTSK